MGRWAAVVFVAALALGPAAAGGDAGSRAQNEAKVKAQVENAITLEKYARSQLEAGHDTAATRAIGESRTGLAAAQGIIKQLSPPSWMKPDDSARLDDDAAEAAEKDRSAQSRIVSEDEEGAFDYLGEALDEKDKLLSTLAAMSTSPCTEVTALTSPFSVNGVVQSGDVPQVRIYFKCDEKMKGVELDTPGQTLSSCDGFGQPCTIKDGDHVVFDAGLMKVFEIAIFGDTLADGQTAEVEVQGDVVPIAGDSSSFQDDVM